MARMRVADYVALRCMQAGASDVFLVTGGGAMHLNDAFGRNKDFRVTCFHHEQAAAMAAEAYYRYSNKLAVLNVTTGPGGINALNGVYGAYVDSIAMMVVSGQVKRETYVGSYDLPLRQLGDQEVNIISVTRTLVKYGTVLRDPNQVGVVMDKALFLTTHGRPGPVWVDIPIDVQATPVESDALDRWSGDVLELLSDNDVTANTRQQLQVSSAADSLADAVSEITIKLRQCKRPVIFLGTGVRLSDTQNQIIELASRLSIPIVTGWNAHDLLPNDHRCYSGRPGTVGDRAGNFCVQNADFVLILGCRLNIRQVSYNWTSFASRAWKIMVDVDPAELEKPTLSIDRRVCCDLRVFMPLLCAAMSKELTISAHEEFLQWCKVRVRKYPTVTSLVETKSPVDPYAFIMKLFQLLPSDAAVVAGNGSACVVGFQACEIKEGQRFFTNSGDASMGYDLPAAIGVAMQRNNKPVFCLAGDGSIMMNVQELATVVAYELPIKVFILNNQGYASIKLTQQAFFSDNQFGTDPSNGVGFPSFQKLANGFGLEYFKLNALSDMNSNEFVNAMMSKDAVLIEVLLDPGHGFAPKLSSRKLPDGSMVSPALEDMAPFLDREEFASNILS